MSKMSKAIAVLGVVAGLGVAALPLSSYAAPGDPNTYSQTTNAQVQVEVEGAISIASNVADMTGGIVDLGKIMPGGITEETADANALKITVSSNSDGAQYNLYINALENDGTNSIMKGKNTGATIPGGTPAANTSAWGYQYSADGTTWGGTYTAVPMAANKVNGDTKLSTSGSAEGVKATSNSYFKFQASASNEQLADVYTGTVVFTAVVE